MAMLDYSDYQKTSENCNCMQGHNLVELHLVPNSLMLKIFYAHATILHG